jgi:hypothetical protein
MMTLTSLLLLVGLGPLVEDPANPNAAPVPITGTVVDADRQPAAGVGVYYSTREAGNAWGGVVAQTVTDAQGRFRLEVPAPAARRNFLPACALWAYRPGSLVASRPVTRETLPPDLPITLVLDPPARSKFLIRGPDGRPVAGARIQPRVLHREFLAVPDGLAERVADQTVTDPDGRAVLSVFFPEEISTVFVTAPGLGSQQFGFNNDNGTLETRTIQLRPVGRIEGRIVSDDVEIVRSRKLEVVVWDERLGSPALGLSSLTTDAQGRFVIPEVPVGGLNVAGTPPASSPWFLKAPSGITVEAGKTTRVEVKPARGVRLKGIVRERDTDRPIAGVGVGLMNPAEGEEGIVRTDAEGRYEFFGRPVRSRVTVWSVPEGFASPNFVLRQPLYPTDALAAGVPPIELNRAGIVRGVVVDDRGEPVGGATVLASWPVNEGPNRSGRRDTRATTGPRGEFLVERVVADVTAELSAIAPDGRRMARPVSTRAGAEPVKLALERSASVSLAGRVVNASGVRIDGARVRIRIHNRHSSGQVMGDALVEIRGAYVIRTRDDGWFRTPPILDPELEYAVIVEADEFKPARSRWVYGKARLFPDVVLQTEAPERFAAVEGRVLDRRNQPVAGASVWVPDAKGVPIRATIDAQGRFRINGVPLRRSFLFVEAAGFRFHGRVIEPGSGNIDVALTQSGEPPAARMTTLATPRPRKEERELARKAIGPYAERAVKEGNESTRLRVLEVLAQADPGRVLEILETKIFANPWFDDYLRRACAKALWEDSHEEALAVVEAMQSPEWRARGHLDACDALPATDRKARIEQVDQALLQARGITEGDHRVQSLGQVAEHYLDLGEVEKGTKLLRETLPAARELPKTGWGGYARGSFEEELAQIDRATALQLLHGVDEAQTLPDRHRINMAQEVASRDPIQAEWLLTKLNDPDALVRDFSRICHAMALKDPDRARQFADRDLGKGRNAQALPFARAHALGMIAQAIAGADKPKAARFLDEAFAALKTLAAEGRRDSLGTDTQDAATVAAALLPVAEGIDPSLVPELFWRAVSFRASSKPPMRAASSPDSVLALLLARYDRDAAMVLLQPILDRGPTAKDIQMARVVEAVAAIDPARAVAIVESLPDDPSLDLDPFQNAKNNARLVLAGFLADPPSERWDKVVHRLLHLWVVGEEDIF